MKIDSPVSRLVAILNQTNQSAIQYAPKLRTSEATTRAVLVDPILKFMGWDISNPDMVDLERVNGNTRLDYGLFDPTGKVNIIVEVKSFGVNLSNPNITTQLFSYGFTYHIQNIILTDGIIWQHYLTVSPTNIIPECIDISQDDIVTCADFFVSKVDAFRFWSSQNAPVIPAAPVQPPVAPVAPVQAPTTTTVVNPIGFISVSALPANLHNHQAPKSMRLPDGNVVTIHYWRDILVNCVKFVLNERVDIPIPLSDRAGRTVSLLSKEQPPHGISFEPILFNGETVYIHTHYDTKNCISNAQYILGFLPNNRTWHPLEVAF